MVRERSKMARRLAGACLCRRVRFEVEDDFRYALNCHCRDCRRSTGSAFKPLAGIERARFHLVAGASETFTHGDVENHDLHCRHCGALVCSRVRDGAYVHVPLGTLDDVPSIRPTAHIFVASKARLVRDPGRPAAISGSRDLTGRLTKDRLRRGTFAPAAL